MTNHRWIGWNAGTCERFLAAGYIVFEKYAEANRIRAKQKQNIFRITSHFWTNIKYSHRVPTSIFVEIYLYELTAESDYKYFLSVEILRFSSMPKVENFLHNKAKIIVEIAWHF